MAAVVFTVVFFAVCAGFAGISDLLPAGNLLWADFVVVVGIVVGVYAGLRAAAATRRPQARRRQMIERRGPCDRCRGRGRVEAPDGLPSGNRQVTTHLVRCPACRGRGY
jgi:membrane protein implicated in regulation of membrane protease activity